MKSADLLLEIGTEELPPGLLPRLAESLGRNLRDLLGQQHLPATGMETFAAPRRIAVLLRDVPRQQPDREETRLGPPVAAARDAEGNPTPAGSGFARSCGVSFEDLQQTEDGKGSRLSYTQQVPGKAAADLLPELIARAAHALEIPRKMRWGNREDEFVRPVHWLVLLLGDEIIPASLWGVQSGRETRGHRFHAPQPLALPEAGSYEDVLTKQGYVLPRFETRRAKIRADVARAATDRGGKAVLEDALVDEVTALVEWPVVLSGQFDERFLAVPQEALITTMCANQKYFPVLDEAGQLMQHFILVSNLESTQPELIESGNERVIRPRFADAEFFFAEDRKKPLSYWAQGLDALTYQDQLGSVANRCERIAEIAVALSAQTGADAEQARQAARLSKADLLTLMVQEFPKLQGTMGRYYAEQEGLPATIAVALEEHYLPRYAEDQLPASALGQTLALADRIELLAGFFALGKQPTGDKDPYGLRRAALGLVRILTDQSLRVNLVELFRLACAQLPEAVSQRAEIEPVVTFVMQRTAVWLQSQGMPADVLHAVSARELSDIVDFVARVRAIQEFKSLPAAAALSSANKRVANILAKSGVTTDTHQTFDPGLLREAAEQALYEAVEHAQTEIAPYLASADYAQVLARLARLEEPVSRFFDDVMVNCEDETLRSNRQLLLARLRQLFLDVADISLLQHGESA